MSYVPYLIANYSTGVDKSLQPWLSPDDAQEDLFDGYVYRGVISKRNGYAGFANGQESTMPYTESRMVANVTGVAMTGVIDSVNTTYTTVAVSLPIRRGTFVVTGTVPAQTATDDGEGGFTTSPAGGSGTIDYITGAVSVTFNAAPTAGTVTAAYAYHPGDPVMGIMSFITASNVRTLIVGDTRRVNIYNPIVNRLDYLGSTIRTYTGTAFSFWSSTNYKDPNNLPRLIFTNYADEVQFYDPTAAPVVDDYINATGFAMESDASPPVPITSFKALQTFLVKDRLVFIRTIENTVTKPQRIRISGTGANCDSFLTSATGAGFIDIPDQTWIMGATFSHDDLIIFTEASTWVMKYTGNDTTPFVLNKIDDSRGSQAPFSAITYLNRSSVASPRGLIITDGYKVERQDEKIPDFSFDEIDGDNFALCFAGAVDEDEDHYLLYPPHNESTSKRILVTNYQEDNYAIYRLSLSCMGNFVSPGDITWTDLLVFDSWDEFAAVYGNWRAFSWDKGAPLTLGGGHRGEVWKLNVTESEDNPQKIRNITIVDATTLEITTDWNNYSMHDDDTQMGADYIYLTSVNGMTEVNEKQFAITEIVDNYTFRVETDTSGLSAYTDGGVASRVIPFFASFKQFNPFIESNRKVRCGWIYFYVTASGTGLTRNVDISNAEVNDEDELIITTTTAHGLQTGDEINIFSVGGMTEINDLPFTITVISTTSFSLDGVDPTGYGTYTSGGYATVDEKCIMDIEIITDDNDGNVITVGNVSPYPIRSNNTNLVFQTGSKKWYKAYINQIGKFIQFRVKNAQAGAQISIHATMLGFMPSGRLL